MILVTKYNIADTAFAQPDVIPMNFIITEINAYQTGKGVGILYLLVNERYSEGVWMAERDLFDTLEELVNHESKNQK